MQAPRLFSPVSAVPNLGELADRLSRMLLALSGNEWSVANMAHKMVIEMELVRSDSEATDLAHQVCDVLLARVANATHLNEATSIDLFTTPEAVVEKSLRDLGIRLRSDCRDLTPRVLNMLRGEVEKPSEATPSVSYPSLHLDSTSLAILQRARRASPRQALASGQRPQATAPSRTPQLLPEERMYWKNN